MEMAVLWRRLDQAGHESARLFVQRSSWRLTGTAVFAHDRHPCRLDYVVVCDSDWQTVAGKVTGWVGNQTVDIELAVESGRRWSLNGSPRSEVTGCTDLDLNFSPSTNLLPIRRLGLGIGQEARVKAAWLRFPEFTLEPLEQLYRRVGVATYHYESAGGRFVTELRVNAAGFVIRYPNFWQMEETAGG
jgi:hypothetical protein